MPDADPDESLILKLKEQCEMLYYSDPLRALELAEQAYAIAQRSDKPHALALGHMLLGNAHAFSDDLTRMPLALHHYDQAGPLFEISQDQYQKARMQIGQVYALAQVDKTEPALAIAAQAQAVLEAAKDLDGRARLLMNLGTVYDIQGQPEKALLAYDQRLLLLEKLGQRGTRVGRTHINRAVALLSLNEFAEAEFALKMARDELMRGSSAGIDADDANLLKVALNLGNARAAQKQYSAAITAYEQALRHAVARDQPTQAALVQLFLALAQVNTAEPIRIAEGVAALNALLPHLQHIGQQDEQGLALLGLARAHIHHAAWQQARSVLDDVLALASGPGRASLRIQAHLLAAEIAEVTGDVPRAHIELNQAIAVVEANESDVLDDVWRASWFSDKQAPFHRRVRLLWAQKDWSAALEVAQQAKARELRRAVEDPLQNGARSLVQRLQPLAPELGHEITQLQEALGRTQRQLRLERWRCEELGLPEPASVIADATRNVVQLEEQLRQKVAWANQRLHPAARPVQTWRCAELTTALAPDEMLIEFVWGEDCIWVWAATQGGIVAHHAIKYVAEVSALCDGYTQAIQRALKLWTDPALPRLVAGLLRDVEATGQKLYAFLISPFGALDSLGMHNAIHTLVFAADGALNHLPFHALPQPNGAPLLHDVAVRYVPGAALAQAAQKRTPSRVVGISGAAEHARHARRELNALLTCFKPELVTLFEDGALDAGQLAERLRGCDWLHLATHAALHPRSPALSSFALGARDVTLAEVADLDLSGACVILSACETALGLRKGSDVFSLVRGFMAAGATTLVTSLWQVAAEVTAEFMQAFYNNLARRQHVAQALRQAQLFTRAQGSHVLHAHPAYWAPLAVFGADLSLS